MNHSQFFIFFTVSAILFNKIFKKLISSGKKELLNIFYFFYSITSVIGASGIMIIQDHYLENYTSSFPEEFSYIVHDLNEKDMFRYWFVLFLPFFLLPLFLINYNKTIYQKRFAKLFNVGIEKLNKSINIRTLLTTFTVVLFLMVFDFYRKGKLSFLMDFRQFFSYSNDPLSYILDRYDIFGNIQAYVFGSLYIILPFISQIVLFRYFRTKSLFDLLTYVLFFIIIAYVSISVRQKAPLLIYIMITIFVLLKRKIIPLKKSILPIVVGLLFLNFMQMMVKGDLWGIGFTMLHALIRVPHIYPYYIDFFPKSIPFEGIDLGQSILGFRAAPRDNQLIMSAAFGGTFVQSFAAGAYNIRGYAQGGIPAIVLYSLLFSFIIRLFATISKNKFPLGLALFSQIVGFLYYMGQTHLVDCLWSSYGFKYVLIGLMILTFNTILFGKKSNEANYTKLKDR